MLSFLGFPTPNFASVPHSRAKGMNRGQPRALRKIGLTDRSLHGSEHFVELRQHRHLIRQAL